MSIYFSQERRSNNRNVEEGLLEAEKQGFPGATSQEAVEELRDGKATGGGRRT
jgi:hypothetical protein